MKTPRYTGSQIMAILKQAEAGTPVPQLCREHDISSASFYKWRTKYGGMETIDDGVPEGTRGREPATQEDVCQRAPEGIEVDLNLSAEQVTRALDQNTKWRGQPACIHCDNGPEYIGKTLLD